MEIKEGQTLTEKSQIVTGDALSVLRRISDNYIDCCVTSPPYYGLRDYGIDGQIGLERTVDEYIYNLVGVFREVRRTLRPDGTLWINIADTYSQSRRMGGYAKKKELCLIPYRLILELQKDGWYVRQDIIWNKPNAMPESVKDRCTKSHEYIFLLTKSDRYYFDYEAIREPAVGFNNRQAAGERPHRTNAREKGTPKHSEAAELIPITEASIIQPIRSGRPTETARMKPGLEIGAAFGMLRHRATLKRILLHSRRSSLSLAYWQVAGRPELSSTRL